MAYPNVCKVKCSNEFRLKNLFLFIFGKNNFLLFLIKWPAARLKIVNKKKTM
jgi:hypothetical protein